MMNKTLTGTALGGYPPSAYAGNDVTAAVRAPEVEGQISDLADRIKVAEDLIEQLGSRLQGVIRPMPSDLADCIKVAEDLIEQLGSRLQGVIRPMPVDGKN